MLYFKSCGKCIEGTVELRNGLDGPEYKCINCGYETAALAEKEKSAVAA